jgi:hypothetical protein
VEPPLAGLCALSVHGRGYARTVLAVVVTVAIIGCRRGLSGPRRLSREAPSGRSEILGEPEDESLHHTGRELCLTAPT